jgi:hypothetical protein
MPTNGIARAADFRQRILCRGWNPTRQTVAFLRHRFGEDDWKAIRGGITRKLVGFVPVNHTDDHRVIYLAAGMVLDPVALKGRASCNLERLRRRN